MKTRLQIFMPLLCMCVVGALVIGSVAYPRYKAEMAAKAKIEKLPPAEHTIAVNYTDTLARLQPGDFVTIKDEDGIPHTLLVETFPSAGSYVIVRPRHGDTIDIRFLHYSYRDALRYSNRFSVVDKNHLAHATMTEWFNVQ